MRAINEVAFFQAMGRIKQAPSKGDQGRIDENAAAFLMEITCSINGLESSS